MYHYNEDEFDWEETIAFDADMFALEDEAKEAEIVAAILAMSDEELADKLFGKLD